MRSVELMWQHHSEFLLLGYGAYATFVGFCKGALPDIPDQHIAQMVAGIDVLLFKPDAELKRLARLALDTGVDAAFVEGRSPRGDRRRARRRARPARPGSRSSRRSRTRGSTWPRATGSTTTTAAGTTTRASRTRRSIGYVRALRDGQEVERPTEELVRERDRLATEYGALLDEETRKGFDELLGLCRLVFPYVEEHKFLCDYWFLTTWWNKVREFGALLAQHGYLDDAEDVFQLSRTELQSALDELVLVWATGGEPLGPKHWPPIVARRREIIERLGDWTPPPAIGAMPEEVNDPVLNMLWGITTERVHAWARSQDGGPELSGTPASPGLVEGVGPGREDGQRARRRTRRRDPRVQHHLSRLGADLHEGARRSSRTSAV